MGRNDASKEEKREEGQRRGSFGKISVAFSEITVIICYVTSVFMKEFRSSELLSICDKKRNAMSQKEDYESRTEQLIVPILTEKQFELVDVEYVKEAGDWYLRAYIDKPGGITIDDCEAVSRILSDRLDEADFIPDAYILEVSSPGLTRPLKKDRDYDRNIGKPVEIKLYRAVNGRKELTADLVSYDKDTVTVFTEGTEITLEKKNISLIRQAFIWE